MLRVHFTLEYEPHLAGGKRGVYASEINPFLECELTHRLSIVDGTSPIHVIEPSAAAATNQVALPLNSVAPISESVHSTAHWALPGTKRHAIKSLLGAPRPFATVPLPETASIAVHVMAESATQTGQSCHRRVSSAYFTLRDALSNDTVTKTEWELTGESPLAKGFVRVSNVHMTFDGKRVDGRTIVGFVANTSAVYHIDDAEQDVVRSTSEYMDKTIRSSLDVFFAENAPLSQSKPEYLKRMHCPFYQTAAGLIPGSAFSLLRPTAAPAYGFYRESLRIALNRMGMSPSAISQGVAKQASVTNRMVPEYQRVITALGNMLTVRANNMVYMDDLVNSGGKTLVPVQKSSGIAFTGASRQAQQAVVISEDYESPIDGGDCEDVASAIYQDYWGFHSQTPRSGDALDTALGHLHAITRAHLFTPALILAAVTNKKQDLSVRDMAADAALAHTYTALIPTAKFLNALTDASDTDSSQRVKNSHYATVYAQNAQPFHASMNTLVLEGTAKSDANPLPVLSQFPERVHKEVLDNWKASMKLQSAILRHDSFPHAASAAIPNYNERDDGSFAADAADLSPFYKGNSALYCSAFRDAGVLDFAFAQASAKSLTHGVHFTKFAQAEWDPSLRLAPYNEITARTGAIIQDTLDQVPLIPKLTQSHTSAQTHPTLAALAVDFDAAPAPNSAVFPRSFTLSVRQADMSDELATNLVAAIRSQASAIASVHVEAHYLADPPVSGEELTIGPAIITEVTVHAA